MLDLLERNESIEELNQAMAYVKGNPIFHPSQLLKNKPISWGTEEKDLRHGRLPIVGETDLATLNPTVANQWHPTKNGNLTPQDVTKGSGKKIWWQCEKGHEWETSVHNRYKGNGCPYCSHYIKTNKQFS